MSREHGPVMIWVRRRGGLRGLGPGRLPHLLGPVARLCSRQAWPDRCLKRWKDGGIAIPSGIDHRPTSTLMPNNLFGHVGRWLAEHEILARTEATDGAFRNLFDRAETQIARPDHPGQPSRCCGRQCSASATLYAGFLGRKPSGAQGCAAARRIGHD